MESLAPLIVGLAPALLIVVVMWKGDSFLPPASRASLFAQLGEAAREPDRAVLTASLQALVERYYSLRYGVLNVLLNVATFTLAAMLIMLAFFLLKRPAALQPAMWRQFFLQGFPVTYLVNVAAALAYAEFLRSMPGGSALHNLLVLVGDAVVRIALFAVLTALSFVIWAGVAGAFGGSPRVALASVAVTLWYGIRFEGLAGVYLYSLVFSSFPFFVLCFIRLMAASPRLRGLLSGLLSTPLLNGFPIRVASIFFAVAACLVISATLLLVGLLTA